MPFSSLIPGSNAPVKAANVQKQAADQVAAELKAAGYNAQQGVLNATDQANTGLEAASAEAQSDVRNAGNDSIRAVNDATGNANDVLAGTFGNETSLLQPYIDAGSSGVMSLRDLLSDAGSNFLTDKFSFNPTDLENEPGYQFRKQQGEDAINRQAAAQGNLFSTNTLKALTDYNSGLASTEYQNAYNRALSTFDTNRQTSLQRLTSLSSLASGLAGFGANANSLYSSDATNFGNLTASNLLNAGRYQAGTNLGTAEYAANTGLDTFSRTGQWGIAGNEYAGNLGLEAARSAGDAELGGANAVAGGIVGKQNQTNAAISQLISLAALMI